MTALSGDVEVAAVLSFDTACVHLGDVEGLLDGLVDQLGLPPDATVCTHVVLRPGRHFAISAAFPAQPSVELIEGLQARLGRTGCEEARAEVRAGHGGRAVVFPGQPALRGTVPAADALAHSAIDRIQVLGGRPLGSTDRLETRDFVRPLYRLGELVLPVLAAGPDVVVPFELPTRVPPSAEREAGP